MNLTEWNWHEIINRENAVSKWWKIWSKTNLTQQQEFITYCSLNKIRQNVFSIYSIAEVDIVDITIYDVTAINRKTHTYTSNLQWMSSFWSPPILCSLVTVSNALLLFVCIYWPFNFLVYIQYSIILRNLHHSRQYRLGHRKARVLFYLLEPCSWTTHSTTWWTLQTHSRTSASKDFRRQMLLEKQGKQCDQILALVMLISNEIKRW